MREIKTHEDLSLYEIGVLSAADPKTRLYVKYPSQKIARKFEVLHLNGLLHRDNTTASGIWKIWRTKAGTELMNRAKELLFWFDQYDHRKKAAHA